ncbi:MAG: dimethylsulfonioproprionate lyase family protein [Rhodobacter sp.]|nr:dimethylsulfonioproprionate lyase family protein [Rhodobacter sp.]
MSHAPLNALVEQIRGLHEATPALARFAPWPGDLTPNDRPAAMLPAADLVAALPADTAVTRAVQAAAPHAEWRQSYSEREVSADFLNRYGHFELFGPHGHFHSSELRGYIGIWGSGLDYDWHSHEAEELYYCLFGTPRFRSKSKPETTLQPGGTRHHTPCEVHRMQTCTTPFLCYAVWKGPGLAGRPAMEPQ